MLTDACDLFISVWQTAFWKLQTLASNSCLEAVANTSFLILFLPILSSASDFLPTLLHAVVLTAD